MAKEERPALAVALVIPPSAIRIGFEHSSDPCAQGDILFLLGKLFWEETALTDLCSQLAMQGDRLTLRVTLEGLGAAIDEDLDPPASAVLTLEDAYIASA
ncbi:MAG: hypothetical protein JSR31_07200 [Nitrospira sp.]|nr:hypothetical protein [Nitrospira sp.]